MGSVLLVAGHCVAGAAFFFREDDKPPALIAPVRIAAELLFHNTKIFLGFLAKQTLTKCQPPRLWRFSHSCALLPRQAQSMKIGAEAFLHDLGHHAHETFLFIVNMVGIQGHVVGQSHTHGKHRRWITGFHEF